MALSLITDHVLTARTTALRRVTSAADEEVEIILHPKPTNDPNDPLVCISLSH